MPEIRTLADACSHIVDCAHKTAPIDPHGSYWAVGTPAMRGNRIDYSEARRISKETFRAWTTRIQPEPGDLLLAREAPVGPVVRIPDPANVAPGQRTVLLRANPDVVESRFLYYFLASPRVQGMLHAKAAGSTVAHLNVADVRELPIAGLIPELGVQRGIAGVLGALDDKIAANDSVIEVADKLRSSLVATSPSTVTVGRIARQRARSVSPGAFAAIVDHYSLPAFDAGARPDRADRGSIKSNKLAVDGPSVLMSKLNPRISRVWEVPAPSVTAVASTEFVVLAPDGVSTSELWAALRAPAATAALSSQVAGTSGSHQRVKPADILALEVADPRGLAVGVRALIDALGADTECRRAESQRLAVTRNELLPLLMSGKVRVRDAEKRVEEVL